MYIEEDLFKSRTHKYIKRVKGRDGKWIYYYRDSSNNLTTQGEHPNENEAQKKGRIDHIRRLAITGLKNGVERGADLHRYVKEHYGTGEAKPTAREVSDSLSNLGHRARRAGHSAGSEEHSRAMVTEGVGHDYSDDMLKEAKEGHTMGVDEHQELIDRIHNAKDALMSGRGSKKKTSKKTTKKKATKKVAKKTTKKVAKKTTKKKTGSVAEEARRASEMQSLIDKLKDEYGINLRGESAPEPAPEPTERERVTREIEEAREFNDRYDREVEGGRTATALAEIREAEAEAEELAEVEPAFAESEGPITRMVEEQARGGNPYLSRAKEVFERVRRDLKPERKETVGYLFQAMDNLASANEETLLREFKRLSGRSRVQGLSGIGADFEKATGIAVGEIINNAPINVEVERMKHGYPAKQFARLKPFLKSSFTSANPDAPPPMPTWGDLKTWTEHGEGKPSWAGTTRTAVPREVYDAAAKGSDGKPKYPPAWMPIHLMPCWNYIVKKSGDANPYATRAGRVTQEGQIDVGANASYQEGIALASLRKYVQKRGGPNGLVDIPNFKLAEVGTSHREIFKGTMDDIKILVRHKVIDPVELLKIIKEEMKGMKKSLSLVIDANEKPFTRSLYSEQTIKKSLISEIKRLKGGKHFVSKLR